MTRVLPFFPSIVHGGAARPQARLRAWALGGVLGALWLAAFTPTTAGAQPPPGSLYEHQAEILSSAQGLVRLPLTGEVLRQCGEDLSDLRVFRNGAEVPHFVDAHGRTAEPAERRFSLSPVSAERDLREVEGAPTRATEHYVVVRPLEATPDRAWRIEFAPVSSDFVREVVVYAHDPEQAVGGASGRGEELARTRIFRLPRQRSERLFVALPARFLDEAQLEVELVGDGAYLEPVMSLVSDVRLDGAAENTTLAIPLQEQSREVVGDVTTVELVRPPGVAPDRLIVRTRARTFHLDLEVFDIGAGTFSSAPVQTSLGSAAVFRMADRQDLESLDVALAGTRGELLRVTLRGTVPDDLTFEAELRQPVLLFDHQPGSVLRFGGGRVRAPSYDWSDAMRLYHSASRTATPRASTAILEASTAILEASTASPARLGPVVPNPSFDDAPALAFAMTPGAVVDGRAHAHRQRFSVPATRDGLVRLLPTPETLAASDILENDLRIVDAEGRQWAYLRGPERTRRLPAAEVAPTPTDEITRDGLGLRGPTSRYEVALPSEPLRVEGVQVTTDVRFVDRVCTLVGEVEGEEGARSLAQGRLVARPDGQGAALLLEQRTFRHARVHSLAVWVSDQDDAPLPQLTVEVMYPVNALYAPLPAGDYALLVGARDAEAPAYELRRASELLLHVEPADVSLGALEPNPAYEPPSTYSADVWKDIVMWAVLLLGVLLLLYLTFRSVPKDEDEEGDAAEPEEREEGAAEDSTGDARSDGSEDEERPET